MRRSRPRIMAWWAILLLAPSPFVTPSAAGQELTNVGPPLAMGRMEVAEGLVPESKTLLLQLPTVQEELALTPAQKSRIVKAQEECMRAQQAAWQSYQPKYRALEPRFDPKDVAAVSKRFQADLDALGRRQEEAMLGAIEQHQRTRLEQIHLRAEGPVAFCRSEVQEKLRLDPTQFRAIRSLVARGSQRTTDEVRAVAASVPPLREPFTPERNREFCESKTYLDAIRKQGEIVQRIRNETHQAAIKLLTKDQHAHYLAMLGEPFDLARLRSKTPRS